MGCTLGEVEQNVSVKTKMNIGEGVALLVEVEQNVSIEFKTKTRGQKKMREDEQLRTFDAMKKKCSLRNVPLGVKNEFYDRATYQQ